MCLCDVKGVLEVLSLLFLCLYCQKRLEDAGLQIFPCLALLISGLDFWGERQI